MAVVTGEVCVWSEETTSSKPAARGENWEENHSLCSTHCYRAQEHTIEEPNSNHTFSLLPVQFEVEPCETTRWSKLSYIGMQIHVREAMSTFMKMC